MAKHTKETPYYANNIVATDTSSTVTIAVEEKATSKKLVTSVAARAKKSKNAVVNISAAERFSPKIKAGLTTEQVASRVDEGLVNGNLNKKGKSYLRIFVSNILTFFNFIYIAVAIVLMVFRQWTDIFFLATIVANTAIAIIQEIKAKQTIDKLNLITAPTANVVRGGVTICISVSEIVLDDIVVFSNGKQICADSIVVDGTVEVNESMLTGESVAIVKRVGDILYSGSYITSGNCIARVDKIGKYNYVEGLTARAKVYRKPKSEMLRSLQLVLTIIAIIIIPLAIFSFRNNYMVAQGNVGTDAEAILEAVRKTASTVISIIPAGPFLLTSLTLAVSVITLARKNTMVQELYCIEMLARANVLCLDKTGTITDGTMRVVECVDLRGAESVFLLKDIIGSMQLALDDNNLTSIALNNYFGTSDALKAVSSVPFSSSRKLSAVSFEGEGTYFLGAPEFVLTAENSKIDSMVKKYSQQGLRVLLLAYSSSSILNDGKNAIKLPLVRRPVAIIAIEDHIREDCPETIKWFSDNGVAVKIISGDNPLTVAEIAKKVGIANAEQYISLEGLSDDQVREVANSYTVFGRVSPDQKAVLVKAMKSVGNTVAMTGDGVNDILALRESDCSIAMASGSEAARNVSHLVLLDNNFNNLPKVVAEGRRVVNNLQNVTALYLMKTMYIMVISVLALLLHRAFPFTPSQVLLADTFVLSIPTVILSILPSKAVIKGNYLFNVLKTALPFTLTFLIGTVTLYTVAEMQPEFFLNANLPCLETIVVLVLTVGYIYAVYFACKPFTPLKVVTCCLAVLFFILGLTLFYDMFGFAKLNFTQILMLLTVSLASFPIMALLRKLFLSIKVS